VQAQLLQEHLPLVRLQRGELRLGLGAYWQHLRALGGSNALHHLVVFIVLVVCYAGFVHVGGVYYWFHGEELALAQYLRLVLAAFVAAGRLAGIQMLQQALEGLRLFEKFLVAAFSGFGRLLDAALHQLHVCHDKLKVDGLNIPCGIG